jgi:hypothetical protein
MELHYSSMPAICKPSARPAFIAWGGRIWTGRQWHRCKTFSSYILALVLVFYVVDLCATSVLWHAKDIPDCVDRTCECNHGLQIKF